MSNSAGVDAGASKRASTAPAANSETNRRKSKKTTYFFKPTNHLTNGTIGDGNRPVLAPLAPNKITPAPPKSADLEPEVSLELKRKRTTAPQSSDDSFDGIAIKWKASPQKASSTKVTDMPSSPLKNSILPPSKDQNEPAAIVNEQADSMLSKYGSEFNNQILSLEEGSIAPSSEAKKKLSDDTRSTKDSNSLRSRMFALKSWIEKFDTDDSEGSLNFKDSILWKSQSDPDSLVRLPRTRSTISAQDLEDIDFSEDFDESKIQNSGDVEGMDLSDDPFSDDDHELLATVQAQSQAPANGDEDDEDVFSDDLDAAIFEQKPKSEFTDKIKALQNYSDKPTNTAALSFTREDLKRYQVQHIDITTYKINERSRNQAIFSVTDSLGVESKLIVRGEYSQLNIMTGDIINVIITDKEHPNLLDDATNLLVWNPDTLVSATTVSEQLHCARKSVLNDRFAFPGAFSVPLLVGIIIHEVFQHCFISGKWNIDAMTEIVEQRIKDHLLSIFSIGDCLTKVRNDILEVLPYLKEWFAKYYRTDNISTITTNDRGTVAFGINEALDIEESIWSPVFGIKGKVDVTLDATIESNAKKGRYVIPMEIKTGREYIQHHAQSSLYSLLFKDRYDIDVTSFLLVYTKERLTKNCNINNSDLRSLLNLRNRISEYLREGNTNLPEVVRASLCDRCEIMEACMSLHAIRHGSSADEPGIDPGLYKELTDHLAGNQRYKDFYVYWDLLITKEESILKSLKKDLWVYTANQREQQSGKALCNLLIEQTNDGTETSKFIYRFKRSDDSDVKTSFQLSHLAKHDRIMVSDNEGHFGIASGYVVQLRQDYIEITTDRRIMDFRGEKVPSALASNKSTSKVLYRIDKDEMFHGMGLARFNILNLLLKDGDERRRSLIVDSQPPKFIHREVPTSFHSIYNEDQITAFNKVLSAEDYCLLLGYPGTGKTTLVAGIIAYLVQQEQSVLLASYTHSAVDNILLKVKEYGINILRIGNPERVHRDIQQYVPDPSSIVSYEDYKRVYLEPHVVGVTCLGINDTAFNLRNRFNYCIIDEASQVSLPISLGPLRFCEKFVLIGDHFQLPPIVTHPQAEVKDGLSTSLFQYLNNEFPQSVTQLRYQYRMNSDIMKIANELIYDNKLRCGTLGVSKQVLRIPHPEHVSVLKTTSQANWLDRILDEKNSVIFLDHDDVPAIEVCQGEKVENPIEAQLVWQVVNCLTNCGVADSSIGVMSLYRAQLRLLHRYFYLRPDIEAMTADQFQGRDKDCVVISLVRSNAEQKLGNLLKDWRRINVAITRAKSKLIILGSKITLANNSTMKEFIDILDREGWIYKLPKNAHTGYEQALLSQASQKRSRPSTVNYHRILKSSRIANDVLNEIK